MKKILFLTLIALSIFQAAFAQTSFRLDNTFGPNGHAVFGQEEVDIFSNKLLQFNLNEGYIIAGGYEDNLFLEQGFIFIRYNNQGKIDTSFGENGVLKYPIEQGLNFESIATIRDAADKSCLVLLKGTDDMDNDTSGIVCFTSKGKWVDDFGDGGILFSQNGNIEDFDIQNDGKILTLINTLKNNLPTSAFERYTQLGILDKTYGKDGIAQFNIGFQQFFKMERSGSSYLCTGVEVDITTFSFSICSANVSVNGTKALNYGTIGIGKTAPFATGGFNYPVSSKPLADGSLMIIGINIPEDTSGNELPSYFITKINPNGTANSSFGTDGYLNIPIEEATNIFGIDFVELANKKILLSKSIYDEAQESLYTTFELFDAAGKADTKFGNNGLAIFDVNQELTVAFNLTLRSDGKVAVGGSILNSTSGLGEAFISVIEFLYPISSEDQTNNIKAIALFPNPVKDYTTLSYELAENTNVSLELFDINGKMIQQLVAPQNRLQGVQQEQLPIDANLPSGQYLLRLNMGDKGAKTIKLNKI